MAILENYTDEELEQIVKQSHSYREVSQKLGYSHTCSGATIKNIQARIKKLEISIAHFGSSKNIIRNEDNVFIKDSTAAQRTLRDYYIKGNYTPYKCSICSQEPVWNGQPLTLILDHINGINNDDRLENLRWVCPNCNQQLETTGFKKMRVSEKNTKHYYCADCGKEIWRGATRCQECASKQQQKVERPSREELKDLIRNNTMVYLGQHFGVTDNTIRKWCKNYKLPYSSLEIKKYSDEEWKTI